MYRRESRPGIRNKAVNYSGLPFQVFPTRSTKSPVELKAKRPIKAHNDWYEHGNANVLFQRETSSVGGEGWRRGVAANDGQVKEVANVGWFRRLVWHTRHQAFIFSPFSLYASLFFLFSSSLLIECSGPLSFVLLPRTPFCRDKRERERERERTRGSFRTAENFLWDKSAEIEADSSVQASETIIWNVNERVAYS